MPMSARISSCRSSRPSTSEVLAKLADATDAGKALDEFSPPQKAYQALKAKLAELRDKSGAGERP